MSRYDVLKVELLHLRMRQTVALGLPAVAVASLSYAAISPPFLARSFVVVLITFAIAPVIFHCVWRLLFRPYRQWSDRSTEIADQISRLRGKVASIFEMYPERKKGEQFKRAYYLTGKSLHGLEEALSIGMYREKREVFVTAFMRAGIAVRVTASIGSPHRCSSADKP